MVRVPANFISYSRAFKSFFIEQDTVIRNYHFDINDEFSLRSQARYPISQEFFDITF